MRLAVAISFFVITSAVSSQDIKQGKLIDAQSGEIIPQAHIQNLTQQKFTVSNFKGGFLMPMQLGDSIWVSCVGYKSTGFIVGPSWKTDSLITIRLQPDSILLEEVRISELPTLSTFKRKILEHEPVDTTLRPFGMPSRIEGGDASIDGVSVSMGSPFGKLYRKISKSEKEKAKYQEILRQNAMIDRAEKMLSRDFVAGVTQLEGKELTAFLDFCSFSPEHIVTLTEYQLAEAILQKLEEYKKTMEG